MTLGEALYTKLSTGTLTTSLGSTNIYPMVIPQESTLPAVTYQEISEPWVHAMGNDPGLRSPRYQVSIWSTTYNQVKSVVKIVRELLQDFTGNLGGSVPVQRIFFEDETDLSVVNSVTQEITYHVAQDYLIWHTS